MTTHLPLITHNGVRIMAQELMTIRQMCEAYDVTPRTLRFYEQKELLAPIREGTKRLYTHRDRGRLVLILRGKRFGFSLEDIRQLLDLYDVDPTRRTQLKAALEAAHGRLGELKAQRETLDAAITDLGRHIEDAERTLRETPANAA